MPLTTRYTVIGAGNGGKAMAAHLALKGFQVTLFNRTQAKVEAIKEMGGIQLESFEGGPHGFGKVHKVTSNPQEAVADTDILNIAAHLFDRDDVLTRGAAAMIADTPENRYVPIQLQCQGCTCFYTLLDIIVLRMVEAHGNTIPDHF